MARMHNSLDLAGPPPGYPRRRRHVGRRRLRPSSPALRKRAGYDVVGVTLQLYDHGAATHRKGACCAGRDIHDARRVAETLGIPHYVLDYESRFREAVIDRFADELPLPGETPMPCVACNRAVKFPDLLATARDLGADVLATGHYVASRGAAGRPPRSCTAPREPARPELFPVRHHAGAARLPALSARRPGQGRDPARSRARFGLAVADKPDSQDICFVPTGRYADVIERLTPGARRRARSCMSTAACSAGTDGIIHFTVGQRRGLGIAAGEPLFVVALDAARAGSWSGRARRWTRPHRAARRQLAGRRRPIEALGDGLPRSGSRCARRGRRRPAILHRAGRRDMSNCRRRRGRCAGPGLRLLRDGRGRGARARRRRHRGGGGGR